MSTRAAISPERCSAGAAGVGAPGVTTLAAVGGAEFEAAIAAESGGGAGPPGVSGSRVLAEDTGDTAPV